MDSFYFQIIDGQIKFVFKGNKKDLIKNMNNDVADGVKTLEKAIEDIKKQQAEPFEDDVQGRLKSSQLDARLEANEKELARVKALTPKDTTIFALKPVVLND